MVILKMGYGAIKPATWHSDRLFIELTLSRACDVKLVARYLFWWETEESSSKPLNFDDFVYHRYCISL